MQCIDDPRSGFAASPSRGPRRRPGEARSAARAWQFATSPAWRSTGYSFLLPAALAFLAGCASVTTPIEAMKQAVTVGASSPAPAAQPAAPAAPIAAEVQSQFDRALQAQRAGKLDDAARQWRELAQAHPDFGGVHANLGIVLRQGGREAEAVASLERAVEINPTQARFHNELGIAYRANGQFGKAREAYEHALTLDANYAAALLNLGILHDLYLGEPAKALALYERYLALAPGGDATVTKWAADLRRRVPAPVTAAVAQAAKSSKGAP